MTEETFDAYLYQLVENKQKFISQIMTGKSPVRAAEDIDEASLSYAEIKMLATGNPYIKEKMDLDIQVSKLKLLKQNFLSAKYELEDKILKYYPAEIKRYEEQIKGFNEDIAYLKEQENSNADDFVGMVIKDTLYTEKSEAGRAILEACKAMKRPEPIFLGIYHGFNMSLSFDMIGREYEVTLCHSMRYKVSLGADAFGNITRLDNALKGMGKRLNSVTEQYENVIKQFEIAKVEVTRTFTQEEELAEKMQRLDELNILLSMDEKDIPVTDEIPEVVAGDEKDKDMER